MRPKLLALLFLCLPLLLTACDPVSERHESTFWYVATTGSDSNTCTEVIYPCLTLAEALNRADEDDQINLAAGMYNEVDPDGGFLPYIAEIDFNVIISGAGRATTIIDAGGTYGGIFIHDVAYARLRNFTIQNATGDCVSVIDSVLTEDLGRASNVTIENVKTASCEDAGIRASGINTAVTLINLMASSNEGSGVATYGAELIVQGGEFSDNGSMGISADGFLTVDNAIFERNGAYGVGIGAGTANLTNLTISENGNGVWVLGEESRLTMADSRVNDNVHTGIEIDAGTADLTNVTISGNSGSRGGAPGAISNVAGVLAVRNSQITQNLFGGISNHEEGNLTIIETTIDQNNGSSALLNEGFAIIENSLIDNNLPGPHAAIQNLGDLTITNSTIRDNTGSGIGVDGRLALSNVTISGNDGNGIWVLGEDNNLTIADSTVSDNDLTGISIDGGSANLANVILSGNGGEVGASSTGGAISNNAAILVIRNSQITQNLNGGIFNYEAGDLTIIETTIDQNSGSPILLNQGFATIENSLIANNILPSRISVSPSAVDNSGDLTITNSTISGNQGAGVSAGGGSLSLSYVTIAENSEIGLSAHRAGEVVSLIANTLIVKNGGRSDCVFGSGFPASSLAGMNIDSDATCGFPNTYSTTEIRLGDLSNNGGPTFTHALLVRSPAIDAARGICPGNDQRLIPRPFGANCDVGAYEAGAAATSLEATSTPAEVVALILEDARCRTGPGQVYPDFDFFEPGQTTIVKGRSADSNWYFVEAISYEGNCWIGRAVLQFDVSGEVLLALPIINPPPTPTPTLDPDESYDTTPTPKPTACPTLINKPGSCK